MRARSLHFVEPRTVRLRTRELPAPGDDEVVVESRVSLVSAGTELLLYRGEAPNGLKADETIGALDGDLSFPLKYGYALVGDVRRVGRDVPATWQDRTVFAFNPHESHFTGTPDSLIPVPEGIAVETAAFLPLAETAVNLVLDGAPRIGERVVVFGAGLVGLTTLAALEPFPLADLTVVEPIPARRELAIRLGADAAVAPSEVDGAGKVERAGEAGSDGSVGSVGSDGSGGSVGSPGGTEEIRSAGSDGGTEGVRRTGSDGGAGEADIEDADLVFELSGSPGALDDAIDLAGYDGRVVVGSWYGCKRADLDLGGRFHRERVSLVSSQVSTIAPELRGRWDTDRRMDTAWSHLRRVPVDDLVTHRVPFEEASRAYELLDSDPENALGVLLTYG